MDTIQAMLEEHFRGHMAIGAGTVVNSAQMEPAYQARAAYIISPNINEAVVHRTKEPNMLSTPGVLSPSKVLDAHEYSADYVKLFPVARMTASYIKDPMRPISHVRFIVVTGITEESIVEFVAVGCIGYGISRCLMDKRVIQEGRFEKLQHRAEVFIVCLQKEEEWLYEKYCICTR